MIEPGRLVQRDYRIALPDWPEACEGLRIDVVTDTHTGSPRNGLDNVDRWVGQVAAGDADVVLLAGDYVILKVLAGRYIPADRIGPRLHPLTSRKQAYGVLGNHDWWKGGRRVSAAFSRAGVRMLDNANTVVQVGACRFALVGIDDPMAGHPDVPRAMAGVDPALPLLVLTHEPSYWPNVPANALLTVTGHTHGGQINPFGLLTPSRYVSHSHQLRGVYAQDGRKLFVGPGIGTSILPMRLGVPPEISRLSLHRQRESPAE